METKTVHYPMTDTSRGRWRRSVVAEINEMEAAGWAVRQIVTPVPEVMIVVYERGTRSVPVVELRLTRDEVAGDG